MSAGEIFQLDQIARAARLNLGVKSPVQIDLMTGDAPSAEYAEKIKDVLMGSPA